MIAAPPGPARVKVIELIVVGFIATLKLAVTNWVTGTPVARFAGFVEVTVGTMSTVCSRPHPDIAKVSRNAGIQVLPTCNMRISFSSSPSYKTFKTAGSGQAI